MHPVLRPAAEGDAPELAEIYRPYVEQCCISFELSAPDASEMAKRLATLLNAGFPCFVAEADRQIIGYAYASGFRARAAYDWTVENSIYVDKDRARKGVGRLLLTQLISECTAKGYRQMIAAIADDGVLSPASIAFHQALGFRHVGHMPHIGYKMERWIDVVFLQHTLGDGNQTPAGWAD